MTIHTFYFTTDLGTFRVGLDTDKLRGLAYASVKNKSRRAVEAGGALVVSPSSADAHAEWIKRHSPETAQG
jgi:hypothetical protein